LLQVKCNQTMPKKHDFHKVPIDHPEVLHSVDLDITDPPAKIDTEAYGSAAHVSNIKLNKKTIGNSTHVDFPEIDLAEVPARVDTGARLSSIWASAVERDGCLEVVFFNPDSPLHTGKVVRFTTFGQVVVSSSMGHVQKRYEVKLLVKIRGKKVRASFSLADRSTQVYPVLIGRNVLRGKFVVDVTVGKSLHQAENERRASLQSYLEDTDQEENI
jgi:hypothetical protein